MKFIYFLIYFLQWLAQNFEHVFVKFGKLVEKENAVGGQRNFSRTEHLPAPERESELYIRVRENLDRGRYIP